ncbi:carbon-nitrogen hydrolase family protein [Microbacterium limosum]|uniref:Carbon-nitrogen hydrolase family protein n=1 Tax=Microbacterium limosum TaxID=3079935 RepID=A0AAU0MF27_9MICO|nr:carbon-nitrogen hydrolase family protein [Microbacterium sp. Y20]WOQ68607.1 carbon-nitrogen hydrolase family protein [Microbacterium sp. Y20]
MNSPTHDGTLGLAVAQFAPTDSRPENIATVRELTERAVARGAHVVLFPEYSSYFIHPFDSSLRENAETLDGPFVSALRETAAATGAVIVAGLLETATDGVRVRNTVVAVDATGLRATYRKTHLYDAFGQRESDWVEPGAISDPQTFECRGIRFALQTCYDLRFPEVTRTCADAGAHVVLVPAEWVRGPLKEHHWRTLLAARAIENTLFVAAADHPPPLGVGHSGVVDPQGVTLAAVGTASDVAVAVVSLEALEDVRRVNPALQLRRYRVVPR